MQSAHEDLSSGFWQKRKKKCDTQQMGSGNPQIPGIKSTEENLHMDQENIQTLHSKAQDPGSY